jgi:Ca-activated chloride channel family protein
MSSVSLRARLEFDKVSFDKSGQVHLLVTLEGQKRNETQERKPLRIGAVVDCSGSMQDPGKLEYAKRSLKTFVDNLTEKDIFGLSGFSDSVFSVFPPKRMTPENKEEVKTEINKLAPISATNLSGATVEAFAIIKNAGTIKSEAPEVVKFGMVNRQLDDGEDVFLSRGFLFTDGLPTAGERDRNRLIELAGKRPKDVSLTTFGYGRDHDAELLGSMARRGGGNFYYIQNLDDCPAFFGRELGGLISCVAQGIKVKLTAAPGIKIAKVYNDLDVTANDEQTECTVSVDDVYAEEKRQLLLLVEYPEKSKAVAARASKLCEIEVTYRDLLTNEDATVTESVKIEYVKDDETQKEPDKEVMEQIARFAAVEAQQEAMRFAAAGDFSQARGVLRSAGVRLKAVGTTGGDAMAKDMDAMSLMASNASTYDVNYLASNARSYGGARGQTVGAAEVFGTAMQADMARVFTNAPDNQTVVPPAWNVKPGKSAGGPGDKSAKQSLTKRRKNR